MGSKNQYLRQDYIDIWQEAKSICCLIFLPANLLVWDVYYPIDVFYIHINFESDEIFRNSWYALCNLTCSFIFFVILCVDFEPPSDVKKKIFIVVGAVALVLFLVLGILWWKVCFGGRISREQGGVKLLHKLTLKYICYRHASNHIEFSIFLFQLW